MVVESDMGTCETLFALLVYLAFVGCGDVDGSRVALGY